MDLNISVEIKKYDNFYISEDELEDIYLETEGETAEEDADQMAYIIEDRVATDCEDDYGQADYEIDGINGEYGAYDYHLLLKQKCLEYIKNRPIINGPAK